MSQPIEEFLERMYLQHKERLKIECCKVFLVTLLLYMYSCLFVKTHSLPVQWYGVHQLTTTKLPVNTEKNVGVMLMYCVQLVTYGFRKCHNFSSASGIHVAYYHVYI